MAKFVYDNVHVTVNSVDLSDHVQSVTLNVDVSEVDVTCMSDTFDQSLAGRKKVTGSIQFYQDFAASEIDATIYPLLGSTTSISFRADAGSVAATNPQYNLTSTVLTGYEPVSGTYGDAAMTSVNFSGGSLAVATS